MTHPPILLVLLLTPALLAAQSIDNRVLADVAYKSGDGLTDYERERCKLDVYLPSSGNDWPVLVWFHGGALKKGDKRGTPNDGVKTEQIATSLAADGMAVVCPNYRFSPEVNLPAYLEDAAAAVAWTKQHLAEHGADVKRLFIGGHSAGGWIAFMLGLDAQFLKQQGLERSEVAGLIPVSGQTVTHSTVREEKGLGRFTIIADEAAPLRFIQKETPPMLIIYGDNDLPGRADENELLIEMMIAAGNKGITGLLVPERDHGTIASEIAKQGDPAREALLRFMGVD